MNLIRRVLKFKREIAATLLKFYPFAALFHLVNFATLSSLVWKLLVKIRLGDYKKCKQYTTTTGRSLPEAARLTRLG